MNLFEPQQINEKNIDDIYKEEMSIIDNYVNIRIEVRKLIANITDETKLKLAKEILRTEKSNDAKVRKQYYEDILKKYELLNAQ